MQWVFFGYSMKLSSHTLCFWKSFETHLQSLFPKLAYLILSVFQKHKFNGVYNTMINSSPLKHSFPPIWMGPTLPFFLSLSYFPIFFTVTPRDHLPNNWLALKFFHLDLLTIPCKKEWDGQGMFNLVEAWRRWRSKLWNCLREERSRQRK